MLYEVITRLFQRRSPPGGQCGAGTAAPGQPGARHEAGAGRGIVITSYSIHYTKLYDPRGSAPGC